MGGRVILIIPERLSFFFIFFPPPKGEFPRRSQSGGKTAETGIKRASESGSGNLRELISWRQRRPVSSDSAYQLASFPPWIYFVWFSEITSRLLNVVPCGTRLTRYYFGQLLSDDVNR